MKQKEKTTQFALTIIKVAELLGMKDTVELIDAIGVATLIILRSYSDCSTITFEELVRLYTKQLNDNI